MTPSTLRIWPLYVVCFVLSGCVEASNWLSGPTQYQNSSFASSPQLAPIRIGVTTKQEMVARLGHPTDEKVRSTDGIQVESLSYSTAEAEISPYQYLPLLGGIAYLEPLQNQTPSTAFSFSSEGLVSGLTVSTLNAYGDIRSPKQLSIEEPSLLFYGMRNPEVSYTPNDSPHQVP